MSEIESKTTSIEEEIECDEKKEYTNSNASSTDKLSNTDQECTENEQEQEESEKLHQDGNTIINNYYNIQKMQDFIGHNKSSITYNDEVNNQSQLIKIKDQEFIIEKLHIQEINRINSTFIKPDEYETFVNFVNNLNVIVLFGSPNTGKYTCSQKLLLDTGYENIFSFKKQDIDFLDILEYEFEKDHGYVFDSITPNPLDNFSRNNLYILAERLKAQNSKAIIVIDKKSFQNSKINISEYSLEWKVSIDRLQLIKRQALYLITVNPNLFNKDLLQADALLDKLLTNNSELLKKTLNLNFSQLIEIASFVSQSNLDLIKTSDIVEKIKSFSTCEIIEIITNQSDIEKKIYLFIQAVFDEMPYDITIKYYNSFRQLFDNNLLSESEIEAIKKNNFINLPRSQRLEITKTEIYYDRIATEFKSDKIEKIKFINPRYKHDIIKYIWNEYNWRDLILRWLSSLMNTNLKLNTLQCISKLLGILSLYNFSGIKELVVNNWIKKGNTDTRFFAAKSLEYSITQANDSEQEFKVVSLFHYWATLENDPSFNQTALFLYSGFVGRVFYETAMNDFKDIVKKNQSNIVKSGSWNLALYFFCANLLNHSNHRENIIDLINKWSDDSNQEINLIAKVCFSQLLAFEDKIYEGSPRPSMLWLAYKEKKYQEHVFLLWDKLISDYQTRELALGVLQFVISKSASQPSYYYIVEDFVVKYVYILYKKTNINDLERIIFHLDKWARSTEKSSKGARSILVKINEMRKKLGITLDYNKMLLI